VVLSLSAVLVLKGVLALSSNRALSQEDIKKLLAGSTKPSPWPNESDLKRIADAVKLEQDTVQFGNGMVFTIHYENIERFGAVFIRPADKSKYVPCGYFDLNRLRGVA
jgi:hypothetical protein